MIRTGWSSSQPHHALGAWACEQGYKKVVGVAADYAFGYEALGGFQKAFEDCGGKVIQKIWPTLGNKDFGPYISTIKRRRGCSVLADGRPDGRAVSQTVARRRLQESHSRRGTSYDEFALPFMTEEVIGDFSALQYSAALETPANEAFVKKYRAKYGKVPSYFSESNYSTAKMIHEVYKKTGGNGRAPSSSSR